MKREIANADTSFFLASPRNEAKFTSLKNGKLLLKKSEQYWGLRQNGWAGAVSGGQGQYRLFYYPSQIFSISKKFFKMLFRLVGPKKLI